MSWLEGKGWDVPVKAPGDDLPFGWWTGRRFVTAAEWRRVAPVRVDAAIPVKEAKVERPVFGKRGKRW